MANEHVVELGDKVRDVVTGIEGVTMGKASYLTGCDQFAVQPCHYKDGKLSDSLWFDVLRLEVVQKQAVKLPGKTAPATPAYRPGGPQHGY